jgi:hypothetical protein
MDAIAWRFESCGGRWQFPNENLLSCMMIPLALPIFNRAITRESMFDLLFGRASAHVAINVDSFAKLCSTAGLGVRWSTRREAARLVKALSSPVVQG